MTRTAILRPGGVSKCSAGDLQEVVRQRGRRYGNQKRRCAEPELTTLRVEAGFIQVLGDGKKAAEVDDKQGDSGDNGLQHGFSLLFLLVKLMFYLEADWPSILVISCFFKKLLGENIHRDGKPVRITLVVFV